MDNIWLITKGKSDNERERRENDSVMTVDYNSPG